MSERKRLTFTAITVALVGIVTGLLLGGALLPSQAAEQLYNERTTTTTTVTSLVHTHDGLPKHTHTITTVITVTETTPHGWFHGLTPTTTTPAPTTTAPTPTQGANEVLIYGRAYMPATITVTVGTTVTWTNQDGVEHTVTSDDGLFDAILLGGDTFSYTFTERGTFTYSCLPHPDMFGRVIVE